MTSSVTPRIDFACPACGKSYRVPANASGREATCVRCGGRLRVPERTTADTPGRPPVRVRRLLSDAAAVAERFRDPHGPIVVTTADESDPPTTYAVTYRVRGLLPPVTPAGEPTVGERFAVEFRLGGDYPRLPPLVRMTSPIFHPNVGDGVVCCGDHWTAAESLADLIVRVGEMLAYQSYNVRSPLNALAARWADLHADRFPIDPRDLHAPYAT